MKAEYERFRNLINETGIKPANLIFSGLLLAAAVASLPALQKHQANVNLVRTEIKQRESTVERLERQVNYEQRQALLANRRYKLCLPLVGDAYNNGTHYFAGIKEGDKPRDRITGENLPKGTIVCDAHGNTAVIDGNGAVTAFAFTGDRDIIQLRLKRFRGSQYSQPVIEGVK